MAELWGESIGETVGAGSQNLEASGKITMAVMRRCVNAKRDP